MPFPVPGSKKCSARVSTTARISSPSLIRERAPKRPTIDRFVLIDADLGGRVGRARVLRRAPASRRSRRARALIAKWAMISEPSASRSSSRPFEDAVGRRARLERRVLEVLRPDPDDHRLADVVRAAPGGWRASRCRARSSGRRSSRVRSPFACSIVASSMFIAGLPMKPPTKRFTRAVVERLRVGDLLQLALAHDGDAVAHRHRLDLVVRDVDRRHAEVGLQLRDLRARLDAQLRVEVRERLVHQERRGSRTIARPIATRWRWPPESARGLRFSKSSSPSSVAACCTRSSISAFGIFFRRRPKAMFS